MLLLCYRGMLWMPYYAVMICQPMTDNAMKREYNYHRKTGLRRSNRLIDLGNAGVFNEVVYRNSDPPELCVIGDCVFESIHVIKGPTGKMIFTAYRSGEAPDILMIVWRDYPFNRQIEEGGDLMLQEMRRDPRVKHLIIDNTYVRSDWMNDEMSEYLNNGWIPGLIEAGLKGFCHLQAGSYLGGKSFLHFGELVSANITAIAEKLCKDPFNYMPMQTSEMSDDGSIDDALRDSALRKSLDILRSMT